MTMPEVPNFDFPQPKRQPLEHFKFKDMDTLTRLLQLILIFLAGLSLVFVIIDRLTTGGVELSSLPPFMQIVPQVFLSLVVLLIFLFPYWTYRATINATALCPYALRYTPVFSAVCYFIPVLSFFAPLGAVRQDWNISRNPGIDPTSRVPLLPVLWWFSWLFFLILFFSIMGAPSILPDLSLSDMPFGLLLTRDLMGFCAAVAGVIMVGKIWRMQQKLYAKLPI